jgi:hypothetical protein
MKLILRNWWQLRIMMPGNNLRKREGVILFELIMLILMGSLFTIIGWRIWKKEQITLIHDYHYTKVTEADKKAYTEKMGKAMIIMGMGMLSAGIIDFVTNNVYGWIAFGICFAGGLILMVFAQIKYNNGIF